jgi:CO dehydrogenase maturation factor
MKIAISGKGGVGKTTLAGVMARTLSAQKETVLAIDADPDANLASAVGVSPEKVANITPLAEMTKFIEERTETKKGGYGSIFKLNPKVDDIPEKFSIHHKGVKLLILGSVPQGGGGCFCPENVLLKNLLSHLFIQRNETVIVDMEAGLEHLGRGSTGYVDAFIVVVEPGMRSIQTAQQIRKLASDLGIKRVFIVGNKVQSPEDKSVITDNLKDFPILGLMGYNPKILEADRKGVSPYDIDEQVKSEVYAILDNLREQFNT